MTKSQLVSRFAGKFELSKKKVVAILDDVAGLAVSETKKGCLATFRKIIYFNAFNLVWAITFKSSPPRSSTPVGVI